jgi:RES domain-containing protein
LIKAWRLVNKKYLSDAFTGEGARLGGGRWNHVGTPVVYVSETQSLAILELFVNFTKIDIKLSNSLFAIPVEIPDSVRTVEVSLKDLKPDWRSSPPPDSTRDVGTQWVRKGVSAILRVPSVIIPEEYNIVINPQHADFAKITIGDPKHIGLDKRMWK